MTKSKRLPKIMKERYSNRSGPYRRDNAIVAFGKSEQWNKKEEKK